MSLQFVREFLKNKIMPLNLEYQVIEGPIGCLLGLIIFDGQNQMYKEAFPVLLFRFVIETPEGNIATVLEIDSNVKFLRIENDLICIEGVVSYKYASGSEILEEKKVFLPEGSLLSIKYNQDKGVGVLKRIQ